MNPLARKTACRFRGMRLRCSAEADEPRKKALAVEMHCVEVAKVHTVELEGIRRGEAKENQGIEGRGEERKSSRDVVP
eukprot:9180271-Karenia_brevis.AAC.1